MLPHLSIQDLLHMEAMPNIDLGSISFLCFRLKKIHKNEIQGFP